MSEDEVMREYEGDSEKTPGKGKGKELSGEFLGYSGGVPVFHKDEMPKRGEDSSSGEVLRYFDGEPDFFA